MTRIPVNPELLTWARERARLDSLALVGRFPELIVDELHAADAEQVMEHAL